MIALQTHVTATVAIHEVLSGRTFKGRLPNGREIFIFIEDLCPLPVVTAGDTVVARLSTGDFSCGRFMMSVVCPQLHQPPCPAGGQSPVS